MPACGAGAAVQHPGTTDQSTNVQPRSAHRCKHAQVAMANELLALSFDPVSKDASKNVAAVANIGRATRLHSCSLGMLWILVGMVTLAYLQR